MSQQKRILSLWLALAWLWAMTGAGWSYDGPAAGKDLDKTMKSFIDAMVRKDKSAVLSFFSQSSPWKYVSYEIGTVKVTGTSMVSYAVMAKDFANKKGWYGFFFHEPNGYTFQVNFQKGVMWKKKGADTFVYPQSHLDKTYIKWKQEGGKWVIQEIGETTP